MRILAMIAAVALGGCVYDRTDTGTFSGKLIVEWYELDENLTPLFVFRPDPEAPLTFTRQSGERYQPTTFITDGGTIPRPISGFKHFSPWGYAKAFIVHDWIFAEKDCGNQIVTFDTANEIMIEGIKTMMQDHTRRRAAIDGQPIPPEQTPAPGASDKQVLAAYNAAITSSIGRTYWETGACVTEATLAERGMALPGGVQTESYGPMRVLKAAGRFEIGGR